MVSMLAVPVIIDNDGRERERMIIYVQRKV